MTAYNYFVTDDVIFWYGNNGLGIIGTNESNSLPKDIKLLHLHKERTNATMKHAKDARLFETIVAVKHHSRGFQTVHVYFQLTISCNIAYVNVLNKCTNFVEILKKGRGKHISQ